MGHTLNDAKKVLDLLYTERKKVKDFILNPFDDTPVTNYSLISSVDDMRIFLEIDVCQRYTDNIFNVDKSLYSSFLQRAI